MPARIGSARITIHEYERIVARLKRLGRSDRSIEQVASEFNRGVNTIRRIGQRASA